MPSQNQNSVGNSIAMANNRQLSIEIIDPHVENMKLLKKARNWFFSLFQPLTVAFILPYGVIKTVHHYGPGWATAVAVATSPIITIAGFVMGCVCAVDSALFGFAEDGPVSMMHSYDKYVRAGVEGEPAKQLNATATPSVVLASNEESKPFNKELLLVLAARNKRTNKNVSTMTTTDINHQNSAASEQNQENQEQVTTLWGGGCVVSSAQSITELEVDALKSRQPLMLTKEELGADLDTPRSSVEAPVL